MDSGVNVSNNLVGRLDLKFCRKNKRTILSKAIQKSPLKVSHVLYLDKKEEATMYFMETSGGMVAGDENYIKIVLDKDVCVNIIQQSATKIYPSVANKWCKQKIKISLSPGAVLKWFPESIIPFKDSLFRGETEIELSKDSSLFWGEIIAPGRLRRNEIFQFRKFENEFSIKQDGRLIAVDNYQLIPDEMDFSSILIMGGYNYYGTCWYISPEVTEISLSKLKDKLLTNSRKIKTGINRLGKNIMLVRIMSDDVMTLKKQFRLLHKQLYEPVK